MFFKFDLSLNPSRPLSPFRDFLQRRKKKEKEFEKGNRAAHFIGFAYYFCSAKSLSMGEGFRERSLLIEIQPYIILMYLISNVFVKIKQHPCIFVRKH